LSALYEAAPLALASAFAPAAILILILLLSSENPRRLVFAYLAGAAFFVVTIGVFALLILSVTGATEQDNRTASAGVDLGLGIFLLALAVWAWRRHQRPPRQKEGQEGGMAGITQRATSSMKWSFAAGLLVYLASPLYFAAIKAISDSGDSTLSQLLALLICAFCVLLFVEIPAFVLLVRPDGLKATLERMSGWLSTNSWLLVAVLAGVVGVWLSATAISALA
jgi:Sap, sulfolipid-1-addressing protein